MKKFKDEIKLLTEKALKKQDENIVEVLNHYGYTGDNDAEEVKNWLDDNKYKIDVIETDMFDEVNKTTYYYLRDDNKDNQQLAVFAIKQIIDLKEQEAEVLVSNIIYYK